MTLPASVLDGFAQLSETTSIALAQRITTVPVSVSLPASWGAGEPSLFNLATAYVMGGEPAVGGESAVGEEPVAGAPFLLLPGFDSSLLEFRRLFPLLETQRPTWTVDLLGFGFTERPGDVAYSPEAIQAHLYAFWQQQIAQPVVLVGASMGGAAAIAFTLRYPEAVKALILLDSAGMQNGPMLGKYLPSPLDRWAVEFLRRPDVRHKISKNAYVNPQRWATADADCCARLHLLMPNWDEALRRFTKSGGYPKLRSRLGEIQQPALILWGQGDRILGTGDARLFEQCLPQGKLVWIDSAGHVPHLERPDAVAQAIAAFLA